MFPNRIPGSSFSSNGEHTSWIAKSTGFRNMPDKILNLDEPVNLPNFNISIKDIDNVEVRHKDINKQVGINESKTVRLEPMVIKAMVPSDEYRRVQNKNGQKIADYAFRSSEVREIEVVPKLSVKNNGVLDVTESKPNN